VPSMRQVQPSQVLRRWEPEVSRPATSISGVLALPLMEAQDDSQEGQAQASVSGGQAAEEALQAE